MNNTNLILNPEILNAIIDAINSSIYWKDLNGVYLGCNKYLLNIAGLNNREDIIGKNDHELPWKENADRLIETDEIAIKTGYFYGEQVATMANGKAEIFLTTKTQLVDGKGKLIGIIGSSIVITPQKNAAVKQQQLILDEQIRVLQLIGGSMAHELRTPLAAINLAAAALEAVLPNLFEGYKLALSNKLIKNVSINESHLEMLQTALTNINNGVNSANNVISFMLGNIQKLNVKYEDMQEISVMDCINQAINKYEFQAAFERDLITVKGDDFKFKGTAALIEHVLINLLKNAVYYVKHAGKGEITIWTEKGDNNKLHFKDTGTGIDEEHLNTLFNKFFSKRDGGTGIGLAFCKQVMTQFGGAILCSSIEGEYTEFILEFPRI